MTLTVLFWVCWGVVTEYISFNAHLHVYMISYGKQWGRNIIKGILVSTILGYFIRPKYFERECAKTFNKQF